MGKCPENPKPSPEIRNILEKGSSAPMYVRVSRAELIAILMQQQTVMKQAHFASVLSDTGFVEDVQTRVKKLMKVGASIPADSSAENSPSWLRKDPRYICMEYVGGLARAIMVHLVRSE